MRKLMMALAVAGTAVPASVVLEAPAQAQRYYARDGRTYYAQPRYYNCRRGNGTTGLIVGGAAGALLGRSLDGGRNQTLGTVLGAAGGALLGREVQRSRQTRNCYR
ncbi:glycine zipper 2TM domain-containing protein [Sphingomonas sp. ID1715]|uniref:glycine zipper 2TM domain-containing protein n=1 Tax=Sphingomonas sp. ID1715 TaxID=1656898 RepID=UPI001487F487|nr:glycine zipper 2TM domain-containing protein [Sphingomonas sp. ID1715]NNM76285.1 glycine zipper 2TM domain-containing protein [Sphingomonas sp. ID1715]